MSSLSNIKSKSGSSTQSHKDTQSHKEKVINYESLKREKDEKIQMLRDSHTNETPSIYIQNSHSHHLWDCKKLEKNYLLIMIGAGGVSAVGDHELLLQDPIVRKLLTLPIITKEDMDERLFQLRDFFPMLTFHYSNYFGIKPINDKKRKKCKYNTTESYFDIDYADAAIFPDDNCESRRMGLTTLEQFQGKYKVCNTESYEIMDSLDINFFDSLDISNYHILSKLNLLNGEFIIDDIEIIKKIMPYLDVSKFNNIRELRDTFDEKDETMKLSELMKINGPGIYIHYACRPFVHKEGDSNNFVRSNNENGSIEYRHLRQNSENTLIAANCPIRTDIVARGYLNIISGIPFGPGEGQGSARGSSFYHTELDFTLKFPDGWKIENLPTSVLGTSKDRKILIELSMRDLNRKIDAKELLQRLYGDINSDGKEIGNSDYKGYAATIEMDTSFGANHKCRVAILYKNKKEAFQFIATTKDNSDYKKNIDIFDKTISSIRKINAKEKYMGEPKRIMLHKVKKGETFKSLSAKTAFSTHAEKRLRVINNKFPSGEPKVGSLVKLVY